MIFVLVYLTVSIVIYVEMFKFIQRQSLHPKTFDGHPEMQQVKPSESLLVVNFDGPPSTLPSEQHPDLGFAEFLANRDSDARAHDDS